MMIEAMLALLPLVKAGSAGARGRQEAKRAAPDIPTMTELGVPGLDFDAWWAMGCPPGLPDNLTRTLNGWVNEAVKALAAEGRLDALGIESVGNGPKAFADFLRHDLEHSAKLLAAAHFVPQ